MQWGRKPVSTVASYRTFTDRLFADRRNWDAGNLGGLMPKWGDAAKRTVEFENKEVTRL